MNGLGVSGATAGVTAAVAGSGGATPSPPAPPLTAATGRQLRRIGSQVLQGRAAARLDAGAMRHEVGAAG